MTNKELIIFLSGTGLGAAAGVLSTMQYFKKKYEAFAEERITEVEEYYSKKVSSNYIRNTNDDSEDIDGDSNTGRENGPLNSEKRNEIKEKLIDNFNRTSSNAVNYSKISTEKFIKKRNKLEGVDVNEVEDGEEPPTMTANEIAQDEHKKNFDKPPRIISVDEYTNLPSYIDTQTLYFYHYDMVVTDDNENEIEDYERLIGDALTKYDFLNNDESIIFVMNYQLDTAYEIQRVMGSWSE